MVRKQAPASPIVTGFSTATFDFLRRLDENNDRVWFQEHQEAFETHVRGPALAFIEDAVDWMEAAGIPYRGEAKKSGGALSRIHRDTRFSKDKTPYHSHVTLQFHHKDAMGRPGPMLGLRIAHDGVGMGGGIYAGDTATLNRVRDAIIAAPETWHRAKGGLEIWGDALKTAPKGYALDHPAIADIRMKAWMVSPPFDAGDLVQDPMSAFQRGYMEMEPFLAWMERALLD